MANRASQFAADLGWTKISGYLGDVTSNINVTGGVGYELGIPLIGGVSVIGGYKGKLKKKQRGPEPAPSFVER